MTFTCKLVSKVSHIMNNRFWGQSIGYLLFSWVIAIELLSQS